MLATFVVESGLLLWTLFRYKMTPAIRLASFMLFFLALFQLAEYNVCGGIGVSAEVWSRVGFVAITALPPLGLHFGHVIAGKRLGAIPVLAYATGIVWIAVFSVSEWAFSGHVCAGNYVIFQLRSDVSLLYSLYYYSWLFVAVWLNLLWARKASPKTRGALTAFSVGYLAFLLPTTVLNALYPSTIAGIPSIMCGFAVLFALILVFVVLPRWAPKRDQR